MPIKAGLISGFCSVQRMRIPLDRTLIHRRLALSRSWYSFTDLERKESWANLAEKVTQMFKSQGSNHAARHHCSDTYTSIDIKIQLVKMLSSKKYHNLASLSSTRMKQLVSPLPPRHNSVLGSNPGSAEIWVFGRSSILTKPTQQFILTRQLIRAPNCAGS